MMGRGSQGKKEGQEENGKEKKAESKKTSHNIYLHLSDFTWAEWPPYLLTMSDRCCNLWAGTQGRYEWNLQLDLSKLMCVCVCCM